MGRNVAEHQDEECKSIPASAPLVYEDFFNPNIFEEFTVDILEFGDKFEVNVLGAHATDGLQQVRIGHRLWPASLVLAEYLAETPELTRAKRVLELGAGLGLAGILAAQMTSRPNDVTITDGDELVVDTIQDNIDINFTGEAAPKAALLFWGRNLDHFRRQHGRHDVIIGADVLYSHALGSTCKPIFDTIYSLLEDSPGSCVVVANQKIHGSAYKYELNELAEGAGLRCFQLKYSSNVRHRVEKYNLRTDDIDLYKFTRS